MKPSDLDIPLGVERQRALALLADRWTLWVLLAVHETRGARFTDLAAAPGLSRRVLAERLRTLVNEGLLIAEQYQVRPPRSRYLRTERGEQVRRLALAAIHVAAGGTLVNDPLSAPAASSASPAAGVKPVSSPDAVPESGASAAASTHPADELLAGDLAAAARIHDSTIAPLARYDSRYRTSLVETLSTWLACDASVSVAAARMYAHRHTIRYRLDRVRELSGLDTSSTADREQLALGLRARRVLADADALAPD